MDARTRARLRMADRGDLLVATWQTATAPDRVPPRDCIANARDALNRAYAAPHGKASLRQVMDAVDWLRRALEQMDDVSCGGSDD